jgi:hypothetical protein
VLSENPLQMAFRNRAQRSHSPRSELGLFRQLLQIMFRRERLAHDVHLVRRQNLMTWIESPGIRESGCVLLILCSRGRRIIAALEFVTRTSDSGSPSRRRSKVIRTKTSMLAGRPVVCRGADGYIVARTRILTGQQKSGAAGILILRLRVFVCMPQRWRQSGEMNTERNPESQVTGPLDEPSGNSLTNRMKQPRQRNPEAIFPRPI